MKLSITRLGILAVVVAGALALACTGSGSGDVKSKSGSAAITKNVSVRDNSYSRSSITIHKNDKIKFSWKNTGNKHTVTSDSKPATFSSELRDGNYTYTHKFRKTGTYSLFCKKHPVDMQLTVKVKKS